MRFQHQCEAEVGTLERAVQQEANAEGDNLQIQGTWRIDAKGRKKGEVNYGRDDVWKVILDAI